jgi:predicted ribonuclease YlaK
MSKKIEKKRLTNSELNELQTPYETFSEVKPCGAALDYKVFFKPKNEKQKELYELIKENEIIFAFGAAGTGKSFVALSAALSLLSEDNPYNQILIIAQTVQSELEIGYLKGSIEDKIGPFLEPTWYNVEKILRESGNKKCPKKILADLRKCNYLTYNHVSFLRGVNIDRTIMILDEAQQYSKSAIKTILTRIGTGSKYIILSDIEQCDNKELKKNKENIGVKYAMDNLKDIEGVGIIEFGIEDIIRNPIISKILEKWN